MLNCPFRSLARLTAMLFMIPLVSSPAMAQRYHSGVQMKSGYQGFGNYDPGRYSQGSIGPGNIGPGYIGPGNVGYGSFVTPGSAYYGGSGFVQQFGGLSYSSGIYSSFGNGGTGFGVARTSGCVIPYSNGLVVPSIITVPAYGFPGIYGYESGWYGSGSGIYGPNYGWYGFGAVPPGWSIDPYSGIAVSYSSWNAPVMPYMGGVNSYFPGAILAPTLLNMNFSMRPSVPSAASYTLTDPRILDVVAPAPRIGPVPEPPLPGDQLVPDAPPLPGPEAGAPLLNEFESIPRSEKVSTLAEKIHSLRYQATGDESFRKEDYVSAEVFYKSAIEMAPDRKAPYIRMAFVQLALANFPKSVSHLKAGIMMPDDGTRSWVSAEELYGSKVIERARSHGGKLWNWLAEQPLSSDRLLLAGTFQKLRGFDQVAAELLGMASHEGPEAAYVTAISSIAASDTGHRAISQDLARLIHESPTNSPAADVQGQPFEANSTTTKLRDSKPESEGIVLRGKRMTPVAEAGTQQIPTPTPADGSDPESAPSAEIPALVIPGP